jgi:hypothetical protein
MEALDLLRSLGVRDVLLLHEIGEDYPYADLEVDGILHVEKDASLIKVLLEDCPFSEAEDLQICVGLLLCVFVFTGRNAGGKLTCRILNYDTVAGRMRIQ